ncbi:MAG: Hsp20/alpha crystallin family protein [Pseudomonadales bacterium]|nr:Hsp20/alpha crystallin family protein [Pseudomonadales bacterium]MCP5215139.1 Hsp20/alpha crystallin family protein [Pseudomonadales bacterium]
MNLITWRPFQEMDELFRRYTRPLSSGVPKLIDDNGHTIASWTPSADISETKKEYLVKAELPDVEKSDIHISFNEGSLVIEGERKYEKEEEDETCHLTESFYGKFSRMFALPNNIDQSNIKAEYKKGVLRVRLPKTKESEPSHPIKIKVN